MSVASFTGFRSGAPEYAPLPMTSAIRRSWTAKERFGVKNNNRRQRKAVKGNIIFRMAYALEYEPGAAGPCVIDTTCLRLDDSPGTPQNVKSLLVIAGRHDWQDRNSDDKLDDELVTVFDNGNENDNETFYRHRDNDKILVIEEL